MRRSIGATSSPGGLRPPVHSMVIGVRSRRPSAASRRARPLANAMANSSANRPDRCTTSRWFHVASGNCSCSGLLARAAAGSGKGSVPSAVPSSVIVVRSSGMGWSVRRAAHPAGMRPLPSMPFPSRPLPYEQRRSIPSASSNSTTSNTGPRWSSPWTALRALPPAERGFGLSVVSRINGPRSVRATSRPRASCRTLAFPRALHSTSGRWRPGRVAE